MTARSVRRVLVGIAAVATAAVLAVPGAALAKGGPGGGGGGPGGGGGGGGGGGPGEEITSNSLSVPTMFVGVNPYGLTCDGVTSVAPSGTPLAGYEINATDYYYVQGTHSWQAGCVQNLTQATVLGEWGDNLSGDAKLKVGSPIRVELGLFPDASMTVPEMTGWSVVKLEPSKLDRESAYGTLAVDDGAGGFTSVPATPFPETRVAAPGSLTIDDVVVEPAARSEINATGKVVYGYNLRVSELGEHTLTYTFPSLTFTGADAGVISDDGHSLTLTINVVGGGGGGGGGHRP